MKGSSCWYMNTFHGGVFFIKHRFTQASLSSCLGVVQAAKLYKWRRPIISLTVLAAYIAYVIAVLVIKTEAEVSGACSQEVLDFCHVFRGGLIM